jgi:hypothetical protein
VPTETIDENTSAAKSAATNRSWFWLLLAFALYAVGRYPFVTHASGQMDEQWFAVPGLTMWQEGIPRIPYCPTRRRETYFENADKCIMALPPGLHFVQAPFFAILPAGYPTARMPLFLGGFAVIAVVWFFASLVCTNPTTGGIATCMVAVSRPLLFTAVTARPDLLCALCGLLAVSMLWKWHGRTKWRYLVKAGFLCGLGALFHPFAIVFCFQAGLWALGRQGTIRLRFLRAATLTSAAIAGISLWLPWIIMFPYEFQSQFTSNVLERSGPGIASRMLWPWVSLKQHWNQQWDFNEPAQFIFLVIGLLVGTLMWFVNGRTTERTRYLILTWSAIYFTATMAGVHPTKGYWLYPIALLYPLAVDGVGLVVSRMLGEERAKSMIVTAGLALAMALVMLPGSGIRTTLTYLRHWGDERYHAGHFIQKVLKDMPKEGLYMSDVSFVFDIYLSGRDTILAQPRKRFWGDDELGLSYLFVGQEGLDYYWPEQYETVLLRHEGSQATPQDCFIDIYVPKSK